MRLAVSGAVLKQALEHALTGERPDAHVAGIVVWYDAGKPAGRRIKRLRLANGKDLDDGRTYTLAVSDFLAAGGSGYTMLQGRPSGEGGRLWGVGGGPPQGGPPPHQGGAASLAQGGAARPSRWLPSPRDAARAGAGAGDSAPGGHARGSGSGAPREARQEPRGVPHEVRDHAVGHADGGGARAGRL